MKKIFLFLMFVLLLSSFAYATTLPYTINGRVNYGFELVEGISIKIEANPPGSGPLDTISVFVASERGTTSENGEFFFDLANNPFGGKYIEGYAVRITACENSPECVQTKTIGKECPTSGGCEFYFDLTKEAIVIIDGEKETVEKVVTETEYVCSDGSIVKDLSTCPEPEPVIDYTNVVWAAVVIVIVALGALYYFDKKKYKWAPGMAGILKSYKGKYDETVKSGDKEKAKKLTKKAKKTAETLIKKYIEKTLKEEEDK